MGGHSHWAGIKHKKALVDAKKGKVFTRLIREITIAARLGGGDPTGNARLRKAIDDGKAANMPLENVKRAIQRGTGEIPGATYEELVYEGYGPGGVAVLCEVTTDSKNRTASEIRKIFSSHGGNLGESGCVAYLFQQKGYITLKKSAGSEEDLMNLALEAGAEDFKSDESDSHEIITAPKDFEVIRKKIADKNIPVETAEITMLPSTEVPVDEKAAAQILALMEELEAHDDVKTVYANFDIPDKILARMGQG
ncbi:MAG: YebC/PmpR family DNA-binding transcriptional regulator [Elusimicrobia bacterium]|nr:YebC/PmpR family DNA-binding transcriptional regulator [Elusimicrobiota bacterium]